MLRFFSAIGAAAILCLVGASGAAAAGEFGQRCPGDRIEEGQTLLMLSGTEQLLVPPSNAPVGIPRAITGWRASIGFTLGSIALRQRLEVFRPLGGEAYRKEAESALETLRPGLNSFEARIPFEVGSVLGLYGPEGTAACNAGGSAGTFFGSVDLGADIQVETLPGLGLPLTITLEPDLDRDGYGDETQDGCPQVAALQIECPAVQPRVLSRLVAERALLIEVAFNAPAQVRAFGEVRWSVRQPGGNSRKLTAAISGGKARTLSGPRTITFRLPLGPSVLRRLARVTAQESLRALVTVETVDLAGQTKDLHLKVRLPGRAGSAPASAAA